MPAEAVYVLDACAVVALMQREPGAQVVSSLLQDTTNRCLIHVINACEIYYDICRRQGEEDAAALPAVLREIGVELIADLHPDLWQRAAKLKAEWRRISLADCFALALSLRENGTLVTSDHHELDSVAQAGVCPITFIR